jgi:hypothetical protein
MLRLLGLSFTCRDEDEDDGAELTPAQQDAVEAFKEKFYLCLSFGCAGVIVLGAGLSWFARAIGLFA